MSEHPRNETDPCLIICASPLWKEAYRKYFQFWLNLARTSQVSTEEAEDIVHGIVCSILSDDRKQFDTVDHIRNYVARAVLNKAVEVRRAGGRRAAWSPEFEHLYVVDEEAAREEDPLRQAVRETVRGLGDLGFEIIKLRFYSGLTFSEISQMLNVPISTLKSREAAAIKKIRRTLRKKGF